MEPADEDDDEPLDETRAVDSFSCEMSVARTDNLTGPYPKIPSGVIDGLDDLQIGNTASKDELESALDI